jgi:hypothetical protein
MSSQVSSSSAPAASVSSPEYARFCQWLRAFFAEHNKPKGINAIVVYNAAFCAGFTSHAAPLLQQAVQDGTLTVVRFKWFIFKS